MTKEVIYRYLGTNGVIESPVFLEDVYSVRLLRLKADNGKLLSNGERVALSVLIPENELSQWHEINKKA